MSSSLLDSLNQLVTPDLLGAAASALGENQGGVSRGVGAVLPMLLGGVATRARDDSGFASTLFNLVNDPANDGSIVNDLGKLMSPGASNLPIMALGSKLLGGLFGSNQNQAASAIAGYAGIRPASASSLLNFAAPLVLSVLGKAVRSGGLNLSSLVSLLTGQRSAITAALPAGLNLDRYVIPAGASAAMAAPAAAATAAKSSIWRWLLPLLILLGALLLLSRCMGQKPSTVETTAPPAPVEVAPAPAPVIEEPAPMAVATPKVDVFFEVDVSALPAGGAESLQPIVEHLNANPSAMAVLAGFHDPTGDRAANEELAKNRAMAVRDALVAAGVPEARIEMSKPVETTGDGSLAQARRVEVSVR
jgi:outer membrane protein OmpA-like peptidoglycan-associated protein